MGLSEKIKPLDSMAFRMALRCVIISLVLGGLLQGIQIAFDFRRELVRVDQETEIFLAGLTPSVAYAVEEGDPVKIRSEANSIFKYPHIEKVDIRSVYSQQIFDSQREFPTNLRSAFVEQFIPLNRSYSIQLKSEEQNISVGMLIVTVNQAEALEPFFARLSLTATMGILRILAVTLLLIMCFQFFVTSPLMKYHQALLKLNPLKPRPLEDSQELINRKDEIGEIARVTNSVLIASANNLSQMRDAQNLLRDYSRAASDWFWSCNEHGKITYVSRPFFENFCVERKDIYGKSIGQTGLLFGDNDKISARFAQYIFETQENFRNFEFNISDGKKICRVNISAIAHFDNDGEFKGYRGVCTDMSKLTDLQKEQEILRKKLAQSENLRAVGQLTGGIAHDFNNILSIIVGNLEALRNETENSQFKNHIDTSLDAASHAASLTHRLLAFSRQQPLSPEALDISTTFSRLDQLLHDTLGENIRLEFNIENNIWACRADPHQLETAIVNLVLNARDAITKHGKITVRARNAHYDSADIPADCESESPEFVRIEVEDNGEGIPPHIMNRIFEPFYSTKPKGKGTGLGLSMVYGFSIQSGGFMQVKSKENKGTVISMNIPRTGEIVKLRIPTAKPKSSDSLKGKKVLVVEDNQQIRHVMQMNLKMLNCIPVLAFDEDSVREALEAEPDIDLFLFDIILQGDDSGPEIYRKLISENRAKPIVFMSGYTKNDIEKRFTNETNFILLSKPFRLQELAEALKNAFAKEKKSAYESANAH